MPLVGKNGHLGAAEYKVFPLCVSYEDNIEEYVGAINKELKVNKTTIFNVENLLNVRSKNHGTRSPTKSTIISKVVTDYVHPRLKPFPKESISNTKKHGETLTRKNKTVQKSAAQNDPKFSRIPATNQRSLRTNTR